MTKKAKMDRGHGKVMKLVEGELKDLKSKVSKIDEVVEKMESLVKSARKRRRFTEDDIDQIQIAEQDIESLTELLDRAARSFGECDDEIQEAIDADMNREGEREDSGELF